MTNNGASLSPWNALPAGYRPGAYIVGGYAVCPALAQDIDLFVLVEGTRTFDSVLEELADYLTVNGVAFTQYSKEERGELYVTAVPDGVCIGKALLIEDERFHKPVQVCLVLGAESILEALEGFDLSVHAFAQGYDGAYYSTPQATFMAAPIRVLKTGTPVTTLLRLQRLSVRYGTEVLREELAKVQPLALEAELVEALEAA